MIIRACEENIKITGRILRVGQIDGDKYRFLKDPVQTVASLRNCGERIDLFTFIPRLGETTKQYPYAMEMDNLATLPISTFDTWWNEQIGFKARNKAKQAEKKGVVLRETPFDDALVKGIWTIYNEVPVRQGKPFPHYGKDIETVRKEAATFLDCSAFIGAYLGDQLIGFIKLTWDETRTQAGLMHIVSMMRHRDKAPTNALVAQAVRSCADRGILYLVYSNFAYGNKSHDSLSDFKERNAFQKVDVPRYFVPLTPLGSIALRFGMHRRLLDLLPEPLLIRLREWRNSHYNRKAQRIEEAS